MSHGYILLYIDVFLLVFISTKKNEICDILTLPCH